MQTIRVEVIQTVDVTLDETKFTPDFIAEFAESISRNIDTVPEHAKHLAWLTATDRLEDFTEGYGEIKDFGISTKVVNTETDLI